MVYCIELINIFAVDVCVFKFFKLPTKILPSDRLFWRGVCLGLLSSARIIAVALLILLLQHDDLRNVSTVKLHFHGFHNLNTVE